jgi:hypothetical protein
MKKSAGQYAAFYREGSHAFQKKPFVPVHQESSIIPVVSLEQKKEE